MGSSYEIGNPRAGILVTNSPRMVRAMRLARILPLALPLLLLVQCGTVDGENGDAAIALGTPIVLSKDPGRDASALGGSEKLIKLADWGKMSSGQNWSKIFGSIFFVNFLV